MAEKLTVIRTLKELEALRQKVLAFDGYLALDTETTGLDRESEIIGYSVAFDVDEGYYVITSEWNVAEKRLDYLETKGASPDFMRALQGKNLVLHNAIFDCAMIETNYGVSLVESVHTDTMILAHLLDENRRIGLKDLAVSIYGESEAEEQRLMKESVTKNGGLMTKANYELYKADSELIARYGAKDTILTLKLFYHLVPELYEQGLDTFFYDEESMPFLRGPMYHLNTTGLRVDPKALQDLKGELEADILEARAYMSAQIDHLVQDAPGVTAKKPFNIDSASQRAWLLYIKLENPFHILTKEGKEVCRAIGFEGLPYTFEAKRDFIATCKERKGHIYAPAKLNPKTGKMGRPKKVRDPQHYIACGKESLSKLESKYKWVERYLKYAKDVKLLTTYVDGIQEKMKYGVIRPSFKQAGPVTGRRASNNPNFQNLPRGDKRVKKCIIAREGFSFVGADEEQVEPRIFASTSGDPDLTACFANGDDFYSVIGVPLFDKFECTLKKSDPNGFAVKWPQLRDTSKVVGLSATYGTTANKMCIALKKSIDETQDIIDKFFEKFPIVHSFMLATHEEVMQNGYVKTHFGRVRRLPEALAIKELYGNTDHANLPYNARNILNQAVNFKIQGTAGSIIARAAILFLILCGEQVQHDPLWAKVRLVLEVHDELVAEAPDAIADDVALVLKYAMENAVVLPGVNFVAEPKVAKTLADLK